MEFNTHETVQQLIQNEVLVEKWQEFVAELNLQSTKMVQWRNSFNLRAITTHELFREILDEWKSKLGRNGTLDTLIEVLNNIGTPFKYKVSGNSIHLLPLIGEALNAPKFNSGGIVYGVFPNFKGRDQEISKILIWGPVGIGKHKLVNQLVMGHHNNSKHNHVIWLNGDTPASLISSIHDLAEHLEIQSVNDNENELKLLEKIAARLTNKKWLKIIDNVDEIHEKFKSVIKFTVKISNIFVIVTSQSRSVLDNNAAVIPLDHLQPGDAFQLVNDSLNVKSPPGEIKKLCLTLQHFHLALQQAIAYIIEKQKCSVIGYNVPCLWNIRNPVRTFSGRASELKKIVELYQQSLRTIHITGLAGIGKTELVYKFASDFSNQFGGICICINSQSVDTLYCSLLKLHDDLGLDFSKEISNFLDINIFDAVLNRFKKPVMIIFDNVDFEDKNFVALIKALKAFNPRPLVIITSRNRNLFNGVVTTIHLGMLPPEDAVMVLKKRFSADAQDQPFSAIQYVDEKTYQLCSAVDGFPLALQNIVVNGNFDVALDSQSNNMLKFTGNKALYEDMLSSHEIWEEILKPINQGSDLHCEAFNLLRFLSYFNNTEVELNSVKNLWTLCSKDKTVQNTDIVENAVSLLRKYSICEVFINERGCEPSICIRLYKIVQDAVRRTIKVEEERTILDRTFKAFKQLPPHAFSDVFEMGHLLSICKFAISHATLRKKYKKQFEDYILRFQTINPNAADRLKCQLKRKA